MGQLLETSAPGDVWSFKMAANLNEIGNPSNQTVLSSSGIGQYRDVVYYASLKGLREKMQRLKPVI